MFKGFLGKRVPSSEFTIVASPTAADEAAGKDNMFESAPRRSSADAMPPPAFLPKSRIASGAWKVGKGKQSKGSPTEQAFDKLLDELQIPDSLRPRLATMEGTVKAAMLKSSQTLTRAPSPTTPKSIRRVQSSGSLGSPSPSRTSKTAVADRDGSRQSFDLFAPDAQRPPMHSRGKSTTDVRAQSQVFASNGAKKAKDGKGSMRNFTPALMIELLAESSTTLDVEVVKKLRLLLRNESASWTEAFLTKGGYSALLTRLNELLEVEWREEQHDDRMLYEILRCFKALSTSSIGCFALRSSAPTPFTQLITLLYSDKKPGEVAARQLIVELILGLFDLYPPSALPASSGRPRREAWDDAAGPSRVVTLPAPHRSLFAFLRTLLLTPAPAPAERTSNPVEPHEFIDALHKPRVYKTYLQELSDVCRDYFWVFCHPNNTVWALGEVDEAKVEKPRAPGGMTGGVEFEAMGYMTMHFKFVNALAGAAADLGMPKDHELSAFRFHEDLFLSGFERILLVARKASTAYYPTLHLEVARYAAHAARARFELPWTVARLVGLPPVALCRPLHGPGPADVPLPLTPQASPRKKRPAQGAYEDSSPLLPPTRRLEALKID